MGLRLKFNLVLLAVFLAGFSVTGYVSRTLLDRHAREQVLGSPPCWRWRGLAGRKHKLACFAHWANFR